MSSENKATYRYTAREQREMERLERVYTLGDGGDRLEEAREAERRATRRAANKTIILGLAGLLIFGVGLSLVLALDLMQAGIPLGLSGIAVMAAGPAIYTRILRQERQRTAKRLREQ